MSARWVVVSTGEPDRRTVVQAFAETMPEKSMREAAAGQVLEILDADSVPLVLELPRLIRLPGEVLRLHSGADVSAPAGSAVPEFFTAEGTGSAAPLWWLEIHATGGVPDGGRLADALSHTLARLTGGVVLLPDGARS
ncbi:hypothetical protein ITX31_02325 [Arthrobacter gandavensis]|uniref:hypothetical protein n=1 Tax=Arthrobacter gandavensis TaxID=169960 RepID=UPI00188DE5A6|nr:hypothetical protein [Arthrobacter gandavensis]MBF4992946.1 hypothetical protein [Arthrobacter gandavensis]